MVTKHHKPSGFLYLNNIFTSEKQRTGPTYHAHDRLKNDLSQNSFVSPLCKISHAVPWNINQEAANLQIKSSAFNVNSVSLSLCDYVIMRGDVLQCWSGNAEFVLRKVDCEAINYVVSKVEQTITFCRDVRTWHILLQTAITKCPREAV